MGKNDGDVTEGGGCGEMQMQRCLMTGNELVQVMFNNMKKHIV